MSEPTKHGLGPADDRDVEAAEDYRRRRAVDEAMAVYSTDEVLSRDPGDNRGAAEDYGADFDRDAIPRAEPEPEPEPESGPAPGSEPGQPGSDRDGER